MLIFSLITKTMTEFHHLATPFRTFRGNSNQYYCLPELLSASPCVVKDPAIPKCCQHARESNPSTLPDKSATSTGSSGSTVAVQGATIWAPTSLSEADVANGKIVHILRVAVNFTAISLGAGFVADFFFIFPRDADSLMTSREFSFNLWRHFPGS